VIARISAQVKSATASVRTSGVLVTTMPRERAWRTSMLFVPTATLAITFKPAPASSTGGSMASVLRHTSACAPAMRPISSSRGMGVSPE
jgi:hypothetical protein